MVQAFLAQYDSKLQFSGPLGKRVYFVRGRPVDTAALSRGAGIEGLDKARSASLMP